MQITKTLLILGAAGVSVTALFASTLQLLEGKQSIEVIIAVLLALGVGATFSSQYFHASTHRRD